MRLLNFYRANARRGEFRVARNEDGASTIYLYDVIVASDADAEWFGGVSAETFVKTLAGLSGPVNLRINSPGGDVFAGVAMAQAIRSYAGVITAHIDGLAASAASAVAVAADQAIMAPGSMMMIHNAWTIALGDRHEFLATSGLLEKIDGELALAYARREAKGAGDAAPLDAAALDAPAFAAMMDAETWLTAEETVAAGLADAIAPEKPAAQARFDLSAFKAPPAQDEPAQDEPVPPQAAPQDSEHRTRRLAVRLLAPAA